MSSKSKALKKVGEKLVPAHKNPKIDAMIQKSRAPLYKEWDDYNASKKNKWFK